jgi:two-component system response regulator AtoC
VQVLAVASPFGSGYTAWVGRPHQVLIVTREARTARELEALFNQASVSTRLAPTAAEATDLIDSGGYDVAIVDLALAGDELSLVSELVGRAPSLEVVAMTAGEEAQRGVDAVRLGATDFIRTPIDRDEVRYVLAKSIRMVDFSEAEPPRSMKVPPRTTMVGRSRIMNDLERTLARAANGVATVLVRGESGSGKELVARRIHELSPRAAGPFVKVHCGALPDNLLESELFGYEKGAFTGAAQRKPGRVELAEGGTLFLDEIGDITPAVQVKLLRVLQDREFEPLGGTRTVKADVRFVAATHRPLESLVAKKEFREDLFYRLNVVAVTVPPLRARPEDIEDLALHFCQSMAAANGRGSLVLDVEAIDRLRAHSWPGNVRQLQNFIERLVVLSAGPRISVEDVDRELQWQGGAPGEAGSAAAAVVAGSPAAAEESSIVGLNVALQRAERRALEKALRNAKGNRAVAARLLGISVRTLYYKLEAHQLG